MTPQWAQCSRQLGLSGSRAADMARPSLDSPQPQIWLLHGLGWEELLGHSRRLFTQPRADLVASKSRCPPGSSAESGLGSAARPRSSQQNTDLMR